MGNVTLYTCHHNNNLKKNKNENRSPGSEASLLGLNVAQPLSGQVNLNQLLKYPYVSSFSTKNKNKNGKIIVSASKSWENYMR